MPKFSVHIILLSLLVQYSSAFAQDYHFTQYYASPMTTNPALTGWFNGDCRFSGSYREQWRAIGDYPYTTVAASFDRQHRLYTEQINYGAVLINDKSGAVGLTSNSMILSGSYFKDLAGNKLQGGLQIGVTSTSANSENMTFDSQFAPGDDLMFNSDIASGEDLVPSKTFADINAGVLWSKQLSKNVIPVVGLAVFHINQPNKSLYGTKSADTRLALKTVVHAETKFLIGEKLQATPSIIYFRQNKASETLVGGTVEYKIGMPFLSSLYGGGLFRYGMADNYDAAACIIGFKFGSIDLGISYDINVSHLQEATNNKGALEVSLRYVCKSTKVRKVKMSCDRI